ncbi:calcium-binding protein [Mesobacterium pallidum]|uniref:calcium-binding protein n=1 Tax=Mesobacterium pallidum TaxID=2872037 RepID=UPI001EE23A8D|nr:calcium-binding protein [Mesobacterium pallidum]
MDIEKIEVNGANIQVKYQDGSREEITAGVYEARDTEGDRTERRTATEADIARLTTLATDWLAEVQPLDALVIEVQILGTHIDIYYDDGRKESIHDGFYEIKNAANDTIYQSPATPELTERLSGLEAGELGSGEPGSTDPIVLDGTDGADDIDGTALSDIISGGLGDDTLRGREGDDTVTGDEGNDRVRGDQGADDVSGGAGDDRVRGGSGDDVVHGGDGNDLVRGDWGNDMVYGDAGHDTVRGNHGADTVSGGDGDDLVRGDEGDDLVMGDAGNDRVRGGDGNDTVLGGDGDDRVDGQLGDDTLDGGAGEDRYDGGLGADVFVFSADGVTDRIVDFEDGIDVIDLSAFGHVGGAAALTLTQVSVDHVAIDLGGGDLIDVSDWTLGQVDDSDFLF